MKIVDKKILGWKIGVKNSSWMMDRKNFKLENQNEKLELESTCLVNWDHNPSFKGWQNCQLIT